MSVLLGVAAFSLPLQGLDLAGRITLGIFVTAAVLWITEAVPLFVTSFVIVVSQVVLLGLPGGPLGFTGTEYTIFLNPFFDPIIALFLGGFVLGIALQRYELDLRVSRLILTRVGVGPAWVLAGFMGTTAFLSMWLSNTATTVLMIAVLLPVLEMVPRDDPFRKALILGIPFAANVGGIGTPIGTPPNAIAIAGLSRVGIEVSFLEWMELALPVMLVVLAITWQLLMRVFPPRMERFELRVQEAAPLGSRGILVVATFLGTVILWLTPGWHGIPEAIVSLMAVVVIFGLGLLERESLGQVGWNVLFIVAGGISLGVAMQESGLSAWIVDQADVGQLGALGAILGLAAMAALMTTFISNSATAALLVPIIIGIPAVSPLVATAAVALAASMSMSLPVSTPPNAVAYGTGQVDVLDMVRAGAVITLLSILVVAFLGSLYWEALGI